MAAPPPWPPAPPYPQYPQYPQYPPYGQPPTYPQPGQYAPAPAYAAAPPPPPKARKPSIPGVRPARALLAVGVIVLVIGLLMPPLATGVMYKTPAATQSEIDHSLLALIGFGGFFGVKVSVYGPIASIQNITSTGLVDANSTLPYQVLKMAGLDALVVFRNSLGFRVGDIAVFEGYYYRPIIGNATFPVVTESSLLGGLGFTAGLEQETVRPATLFRPWWDGTMVSLVALGGGLAAVGVAIEVVMKKRAAPTPSDTAAVTPAPTPVNPPTGPPAGPNPPPPG